MMIHEKNLDEEINRELSEIKELLTAGDSEGALNRFSVILEVVEREGSRIQDKSKATFYSAFAYFLFEVSEYTLFFEMLIKAQKYGYSKTEIENFVYAAFIKPNIDEFEQIYSNNISCFGLSSSISEKNIINFENLPYWLLPTGVTNEYFMFDKKEKVIGEKIYLVPNESVVLPSFPDTFSDCLLVEDWNLEKIITYSKKIDELGKKTYIVINKFDKFLSCLQGVRVNAALLNNVFFFNGVKDFKDYFMENDSYLPFNILDFTIKGVAPICNEIHQHRIRNLERERTNILLSICIPSFNRGERAYNNIKYLLQSYYNDEIEIVLSNNGTENETKQFYDKIESIQDARLKYFRFSENQGFAVNLSKACEMASGKFILLLSDEDTIDFKVLHKVMNELKGNSETISIYRTSSMKQYNLSNLIADAGKEALRKFMFSSNYMSGVILNRILLEQHNGLKYIKENNNNGVCTWYPHMYWELLLCQYGIVKSTDMRLIHEGTAEKSDFDSIQLKENEVKIPYYATLKGRLGQHEGFTEILRGLDINQNDTLFLREMYIHLCEKTLFLVQISVNAYFKKAGENGLQILEEAYSFCVDESKYKINISSNPMEYQKDAKIINYIYNEYLKRI